MREISIAFAIFLAALTVAFHLAARPDPQVQIEMFYMSTSAIYCTSSGPTIPACPCVPWPGQKSGEGHADCGTSVDTRTER